MSSSLLSEIRAGILTILPAAVAMYPFGLLFGQQAAAKGLTPLEVLAMSSFVFAGSAQFLAVSLWEDPVPLAALTLAALLINLRHVLMGASLAGKIAHFGPWRWPAVFLMTDEAWAMAERRALEKPLTLAFWFASAVFLFLNWQALTLLGALLGSFIKDPTRYGLDFAFPAVFIALTLSFWQGWRTAPVIGVAALTAAVCAKFLPGAWYVLFGALAGMLVAALVPPPEKEVASHA